MEMRRAWPRPPFTNPANTGVFHEFLQACHATGLFYQFAAVLQLTTTGFLITQRDATLGAALITPILAAILCFAGAQELCPPLSSST